MNVPDTIFAALKAVEPACDARIVQLPVLFSITLADETLFAIDWPPIEQDPIALKMTCKPFGTPADMAVAVTVGGFVIITELGSGARAMVWSFFSTAGGDGGLCRCPAPPDPAPASS